MSYSTLENYYYTLDSMKRVGNDYSIQELENMYPFERDIVVDMAIQRVKDAKDNSQGQDFFGVV